MSTVFWETEPSELMWKQSILSINNISCFIWLVVGCAFFFFLFKTSAFIYHHPGTYLDSQWTENKAWICWKNHLAHVVLSKYNSLIKAQSVFCKSYPKQILDEEYTEAFRFLTVPFQRHAILNVASCDAVWTKQTFCLQLLFLAFMPLYRDNCIYSFKIIIIKKNRQKSIFN